MGKKKDFICLSSLAVIAALIDRLETKLGDVMTRVDELDAKLENAAAQLAKAKEEIVTQIQVLKDELANVAISERAEAALTNISTIAQVLDDLNPDPEPQPDPVVDPSDPVVDENGQPIEEQPITDPVEDQPVQ